ncbi:MAG: hypothetical protein IJT50_10285 [Lentisphaeria bacterium]|nr:hypothetical protein [Lentisphaeria bacterium]
MLDDLIAKINAEERACDTYLALYCPKFYKETSSTRVTTWLNDAQKDEEKRAKGGIETAINNIDTYVLSRSQALANSFFDGLKRRIDDFSTYGLGRPWGTEFRRRLATAFKLRKEVDNLWELGLNSIANSQRVTLGKHFVDLIINDPAMEDVRKKVNTEVIADIKSQARRIPLLEAEKFDGRIRGEIGKAFGGERNGDSMLQQLQFTLRHPIDSFSKYSDTWNVGINELTWALRHGTVRYEGIYHALYNASGFVYLWEMEFSIEDILDLRPRSGGKLNFDNPYNVITSILGSVYHDLLGNTDSLKVRAHWNEMGDSGREIISWRS